MYPRLYDKLVSGLTEQMTNHIAKGEDVPYDLRMSLSLFMGHPLDSSMSPSGILSSQSSFNAPKSEMASQAMPAKVPQNSFKHIVANELTPNQAGSVQNRKP